MQNLTAEGRRLVDEIAARNGLSVDAALVLLQALRSSNGHQAQFNHPDWAAWANGRKAA